MDPLGAGDGQRRGRAQVLVVDDEEDVRELLSLALNTMGYDVACARDGVEALEKLGAEPALMLLDLAMPRLDGWGVLRQLRQRPKRPPVLVLTGRGDGRAFVNTFREGAEAFIVKPFRLDTLGTTCRHILELRQRQRIPAVERRREPRRDFVVGVTHLSNQGASFLSGELVNLSRHGARLRFEAPLSEGESIGFEVRASAHEAALTFVGRIRWVSERSEGPLHGVALQDCGEQAEGALDALFLPPV